MSVVEGPNVNRNSLVLNLDVANDASFRGEPTTNLVTYPVSPTRYNNPGFSGTLTTTSETYLGSPVWETTFIPQDSSFIPRLGNGSDGFGISHVTNTIFLPNTEYMASIYVKSEYPLLPDSTLGFRNQFSNISGWGANNTSTTRLEEGNWYRLYTKYFINQVINGVSYIPNSRTYSIVAVVNTTGTTQVLATVTLNANGTFSTSTTAGTSTAGGTINQFSTFEGVRAFSPSITNTGGISGLTTGTSAILNHGLNTSTWTKASDTSPVMKSSFPTQYYILLNIPSTGGVNVNVTIGLNFQAIYSGMGDSKFWKVTFDVSNMAVNDVARVYWAAPMIEQTTRNLPTKFTIGTRGSTVATGGGWGDLSRNNNHGTFVSQPLFDSSNLGSLIFDGVDDAVTIPAISGLFPSYTGGVTYEVWHYASSSDVWHSGTSSGTNIISRGSGVGYNGLRRFISNNNVQAEYFCSTGVVLATAVIQRDVWAHLVSIWDGTSGLIYVNGILISSTTGNLTCTPSTSQITIGGTVQTSSSGTIGTFQGRLNGIKIYNRALTAAEVLQNFNATKSRYGL